MVQTSTGQPGRQDSQRQPDKHKPHAHHGHHGHTHHHHGSSSIGIAFFLNLSFTLIELVGGVLTNSLAILSDAVHDLGDCVALGLTWYLEKYSQKQRDAQYTYGYRRWSVAGAVISSLILLLGSVLILKEAIPRVLHPEPVLASGMIALACLGVFANGLAVLKLRDSHSPGEKAARLHLLEDVLGWIVVLVGAVVMWFTNWTWLDPVLSIAVSLFILRNVLINIKSFSRILLQAVPDGVDLDDLQRRIEAIPGVSAVHDLHIWTLDSSRHVLSLHVVIPAESSRADLLNIKYAAKDIIRNHGIAHDTLEMEYADEACQLECC
ncbi:MAG: cation transporter [Candidatus Melainabacteria bacterium HGW-Melainabacteria-1]|nr:MAG: cation transporter [Candidatus Melainabacteria bacterium HGW-Melainabacteria-1]